MEVELRSFLEHLQCNNPKDLKNTFTALFGPGNSVEESDFVSGVIASGFAGDAHKVFQAVSGILHHLQSESMEIS